MVPMQSTKFSISGSDETRLLKTARESILTVLESEQSLKLTPNTFSLALQEERSSFVTLRKEKELRGCIGTLYACRPLVIDVAENAAAAAFRDHRFPPLTIGELPEIKISISILSTPSQIFCSSEEDLLEQLQPGTDGVILTEGGQKASFLPVMWSELSEPREFIAHLKVKAGLDASYWSRTIQFARYSSKLIQEN